MQKREHVPLFASFRKYNEDVIVWPFGVDNAIGVVTSNCIKTINKGFEDKKPEVGIWRDGLISNPKLAALASSSKFVSGNANIATDDRDGFSRKLFH